MDEYITKRKAIESADQIIQIDDSGDNTVVEAMKAWKVFIEAIPAADVVPYSIAPDGTLTIRVPKGTKRIGRILVEEDGTQYGGLFYPDTGGCFLSSMERSE